MSQSPSKAGSLPWGLLSAVSGGLSLGVMLLSCAAGVPGLALPFALIGLVTGYIERGQTDGQAPADLELANTGIKLSLATIALQVLFIVVMMMFVAVAVVGALLVAAGIMLVQ